MNGNWYVLLNGEETGPFSYNQLREIEKSGQLRLFDSVRKGPTGDWVFAKNVRGRMALELF